MDAGSSQGEVGRVTGRKSAAERQKVVGLVTLAAKHEVTSPLFNLHKGSLKQWLL